MIQSMIAEQTDWNGASFESSDWTGALLNTDDEQTKATGVPKKQTNIHNTTVPGYFKNIYLASIYFYRLSENKNSTNNKELEPKILG